MQLTQQDHRPAETRIDPLTGRTVEIRPVGDIDQPAEIISPVEARQGRLGRPVLMVLIAGLILGAIYVLATTFWAVDEELPPSGEVAPVVTPAPATPPAALAPTPAPAPEAPPAAAPSPAPAPAP